MNITHKLCSVKNYLLLFGLERKYRVKKNLPLLTLHVMHNYIGLNHLLSLPPVIFPTPQTQTLWPVLIGKAFQSYNHVAVFCIFSSSFIFSTTHWTQYSKCGHTIDVYGDNLI